MKKYIVFLVLVLAVDIALHVVNINQNHVHLVTEASWYSRKECCTPKNPDALMANGRPLDDNALTCASWDYPFGTQLKIHNLEGTKSVIVTVTDRGPAKRLYNAGRKLDLSKAAFTALAPIEQGVIRVQYEEVK